MSCHTNCSISGTYQVEGIENASRTDLETTLRRDSIADQSQDRYLHGQAEHSQTAGGEDISKQNRSIDFNHQPDFLRLCSLVMRNECYSRGSPSTMPIYAPVAQM
ncbi:hypothetical protein CGCTS75_v002379 [Colletotrichum tropicale]|nr:hypothetical protein CGCTS75_v002379 [Colletotrichum tropicale]